jgi:rRNA biogenesis protein RRP5
MPLAHRYATGGEDKGKAGGKKARKGAAGVLTATADPKRVAAHVTHESDGTAMATLLPGMLVNARVRIVLVDGRGLSLPYTS